MSEACKEAMKCNPYKNKVKQVVGTVFERAQILDLANFKAYIKNRFKKKGRKLCLKN